MFSLVKKAASSFMEDDCPRMAAAMSFFTVFSLPPLLLLVLIIAGTVVDPALIEGRIESEMGAFLGEQGARQIGTMLENVSRPGSGGVLATLLSVGGLLLGATAAFGQLQSALNKAWNVDPKEEGLVKGFGMKRLLSLGMVMMIAFLLLVSLLLSTAIGAFGESLAGWLPGGLSTVALQLVEIGISLAVVTILFATMFRFLPDAKVAWPDVWVGAISTATLFMAGKFLIAFYLSRSDPGEAYGAAGSLAVILIWIYYSAVTLFFGAELTQAWAFERGSGIRSDAEEPGGTQTT